MKCCDDVGALRDQLAEAQLEVRRRDSWADTIEQWLGWFRELGEILGTKDFTRLASLARKAQGEKAALAAALRGLDLEDWPPRDDDGDCWFCGGRFIRGKGQQHTKDCALVVALAALSGEGKAACGGVCCDRPGVPAMPNEDSSEWLCDCACHFSGEGKVWEQVEKALKAARCDGCCLPDQCGCSCHEAVDAALAAMKGE